MTRILGPGLYERIPCPVHGATCVQVVNKISRQEYMRTMGMDPRRPVVIEDHRTTVKHAGILKRRAALQKEQA